MTALPWLVTPAFPTRSFATEVDLGRPGPELSLASLRGVIGWGARPCSPRNFPASRWSRSSVTAPTTTHSPTESSTPFVLAVLASALLVAAAAVAGYWATLPRPAPVFRYAGAPAVVPMGNDGPWVPNVSAERTLTRRIGRQQRAAMRRLTSERGLGGKLRFAVIHRILAHHRSEVRYCYQWGRESDPALSGRVSIAFIIDRFGHVTTANVVGETLSNPHARAAVTECLVSSLRGWYFPRPPGGAKAGVVYPFVLSPG